MYLRKRKDSRARATLVREGGVGNKVGVPDNGHVILGLTWRDLDF